MEPNVFDSAPTLQRRSRMHRARSLRSSRPFNVAAFFSALHYLGVVTTLTAFTLMISDHSLWASYLVLVGAGFSAITWLVALIKRRSAICPLCKGTPMINSGALPHAKAARIFPLNHGVSATLSILTTQKFRCMYCASDFDLLKTPSHLRGLSDDDAGGLTRQVRKA